MGSDHLRACCINRFDSVAFFSTTKYRDVRPWPWPGLKAGNFGLGLGLGGPGLGLGLGLGTQALALQRYKAKAKADTMVARRTTEGTPASPDDSAVLPPPAKKSRGLFAHYTSSAPSQRRTAEDNPQQQLLEFLSKMQNSEFDDDVSISSLCNKFPLFKPLFEHVFCVPASSAPVERIFSQSGLIMRPNRARMSDSMLESLVFLRCNSHL